jgi:hypothetical protein
MEIEEAQARLLEKQRQTHNDASENTMKTWNASSETSVEEIICGECGEVCGGYFHPLPGVKLHVPKECRCRRNRREADELARETELARLREYHRTQEVITTVGLVCADMPGPFTGHPLDLALIPFIERFDGHTWLVLNGPVGVGKTTQAWAVMLELAKRGHLLYKSEIGTGWGKHPFAVWNVARWLDALRRSYNDDAPPPDLSYPWLLILDDLGAERIRYDSDGDSWVREQLHKVLDQRWQGRKPTIITSNLRPAEIGKRLDERIADRIFDKRLTTVVTLTGESWRRRIPEATP